MKPFYEDLSGRQGAQSFVAYLLEVPAFEFKWHYHPEYELTLILQGSGKRLVGDSHENFGPGDLVLIGPSMPHTWVSDQLETDCKAIVIQFPEVFARSFSGFRELDSVEAMLKDCRQGVCFPGEHSARRLLEDLTMLSPSERFIQLISVLEYLSRQRRKTLASEDFNPVTGGDKEARINKVCRYVHRNIDRRFSLDEVAGLVFLSGPAFCKFFKRAMGKTFSDYVNDVRIGRACSLLTSTDQPISTIAYSCGFENMSYFNRIFLRKKSINPKAFRESFFHVNQPLTG
ncbi:MAG: hypothetical protein DI535_06085 [Citrobacter freundii]|nr:MAG: hypothetical protein DI535_06085 [Citrobacter freundii]